MLGSRYNDSKERLENRRSSFFLTSSTNSLPHAASRRIHSTGSSTVSAVENGKPPIRRHTIAKTRSLDSGVRVPMRTEPFRANNPQDDYGSTNRTSFSSDNDAPLLSAPSRRSKSVIGITPRSCGDLSHIDEKPVSFSNTSD